MLHSQKTNSKSTCQVAQVPKGNDRLEKPSIFRGENISFREGKLVDYVGSLNHVLTFIWLIPVEKMYKRLIPLGLWIKNVSGVQTYQPLGDGSIDTIEWDLRGGLKSPPTKVTPTHRLSYYI